MLGGILILFPKEGIGFRVVAMLMEESLKS